MKATGIVRRIDDLGRVVIPKEIRRTMKIREGDPLEIFTSHDGEVIFKKYSPMGEMNQFAAQYAETLYRTCSLPVIICDRDTVIACAGVSKKEYIDRKISAEIDGIMEDRSLYFSGGNSEIFAYDGAEFPISCAMPIIAEGDITGIVASVDTADKKNAHLSRDIETKLIQTAAVFLSKQIEE